MNDNEKRAAMRKYFKPFPMWTVWFIIVGLVLFLIGTQVSGGVLVTGLLIIGIGAFGLWSYLGGRPNDEQMDQWFEEDMKDIEESSFGQTGLDKSEVVADPVRVHGPILWNMEDDGIPHSDVLFKKGKDDVVRFAVNHVNIILLCEHQLASYSCVFNSLKRVSVAEETDMYFYKDVVSVATKTESSNFSLPNGEKLVKSKMFVLTTSGGTSVKVMISDPKLAQFTKVSTIPTTIADKAVETTRRMVMTKKQTA